MPHVVEATDADAGERPVRCGADAVRRLLHAVHQGGQILLVHAGLRPVEEVVAPVDFRPDLDVAAGLDLQIAETYACLPHSRGSTGSLSMASTPKTHSWTRAGGSRNEALEPLDAERGLPQRQRALSSQTAGAQPFEVFRKVVFRPVDQAQVLAAPALECRLHQSARACCDEGGRLDHHALAAGGRQRLPPGDGDGAGFYVMRSTERQAVGANGAPAAVIVLSVSICQAWSLSTWVRPSVASRWNGASQRSSTEPTGQQ